MAIKLYRSNYDEFDSTKNGGDITDTQIESGVLHSFIPHVRPFMAENGGERWFKFYIKSDVDIVTVGVDIAKPSVSPTEDVFIAKAQSNEEVENDLDKDNIRLYGGFVVNSVDSSNKQITADRDVSGFVKTDDFVTFYDTDTNRVTMMEVENVDADKITFKKWTDKTIKTGYTGSSTIFFDEIKANSQVGLWLKQVVAPYTDAMEDPADEFKLNIWYENK